MTFELEKAFWQLCNRFDNTQCQTCKHYNVCDLYYNHRRAFNMIFGSKGRKKNE